MPIPESMTSIRISTSQQIRGPDSDHRTGRGRHQADGLHDGQWHQGEPGADVDRMIDEVRAELGSETTWTDASAVPARV